MNDKSNETLLEYKKRILRVLVHIQRNLDGELSLDELARTAHFSPFHFHRIFRSLTGESVKEHVRRLRLERAASQLKHGEKPIIRIALEAGYETHESFTRAFRASFDCSPSAFRRRAGEKYFAPVENEVHYSPDGTLADYHLTLTGGTEMDVRIEEFPATKVAFARGVGPYKISSQQAWEKMCGWAFPQGAVGPNTLWIGICHDDPEVTPPEKIRYDAAITLTGEIRPEGEIGIQEIPAGTFGVMTHRGPHEGLAAAWSELCGRWLPQSGYQLRNASSFEIYRNNCQDTPPEDLITDLYVPVEK